MKKPKKDDQLTINPNGCTNPFAGRAARLLKLKNPELNYYVFEGNPEGQLENGSFYRDRPPPFDSANRYSHYMNGDFMGFVAELPKDRIKVRRELALRLVPKCCRV
jgi:hypothetical protein